MANGFTVLKAYYPIYGSTGAKLYPILPVLRNTVAGSEGFTREAAKANGRCPPSQDWPAYNAAQTQEKIQFKILAADLLHAVEEDSDPSPGRNGYDIRTRLFSLLLQSYTGKSARRLGSELEEARRQGYIPSVPHFNSVLNFYHDEHLPGLLHDLISITAHPLESVELDFTADATGFTASKYEEWQEARGRFDEAHQFKKLHAMSGVKTNVITAARVSEGPAHESPYFSSLVRQTAEHFTIREISADKAYSSRDNLKEVSQQGGIPFIPFKSNATGRSRGAFVWSRMYDYFHEHHEEFMQHYHKRSNAETVFSMMKRKLTMKLRNEKDLSQRVELLLKCVAHNLIVLVHEMHELGIRVDLGSCADRVHPEA